MSDHHHQAEPILCARGCGFFGNPTTQNMCSKCHREYEKEHKTPAATPAAAPEAAPPLDQAFLPAPLLEDPAIAVPAISENPPNLLPKDPNGSAADGISSGTNAGPSAEPQLVESEPPLKKAKNRCGICSKKVGIMGWDCKCGGKFCSDHRYAEAHECTFGHQEANRERLEKQLARCVADKLNERV